MGVSGYAAWGPLSDSEFGEVLRLASEVTREDLRHDLLSAVYEINHDTLRPTGRPERAEAELGQVARVLIAETSPDEPVGGRGGEVAEVNAWLAERSRKQPTRQEEDTNPLAASFTRAADQIDIGHAPTEAHGGKR